MLSPAQDVTPVERVAVAFVTALRWVGIDVPVGSALTFYQALGAVGIQRRDSVYWSGRAAMVHDPEEFEAYDYAFAAFWHGDEVVIGRDDEPDESGIVLAVDQDDPGQGDDPDQPDAPVIALRYSAHEVLGAKDFSEYDADELAEAQRLMQRMATVGGRRPSRRRVPTSRTRGRPDLRRTVRQAIRCGGEPLQRRFTTPGDRLRRVVFLLDVSGSMETYARALVRFVQAAVAGRRRVEVFTMGTRLTRVTRELSGSDPDRAVAQASAVVSDWSGGTRLGESLREFNNQWGQRGMARGAMVVILSDGWDRGGPELMAEQMGRLQRLTHEIIWVNPLKASPGYQPLAQGMAAALPYVDRFIEGHCLDSLEILAALLAEKGTVRS